MSAKEDDAAPAAIPAIASSKAAAESCGQPAVPLTEAWPFSQQMYGQQFPLALLQPGVNLPMDTSLVDLKLLNQVGGKQRGTVTNNKAAAMPWLNPQMAVKQQQQPVIVPGMMYQQPGMPFFAPNPLLMPQSTALVQQQQQQQQPQAPSPVVARGKKSFCKHVPFEHCGELSFHVANSLLCSGSLFFDVGTVATTNFPCQICNKQCSSNNVLARHLK